MRDEDGYECAYSKSLSIRQKINITIMTARRVVHSVKTGVAHLQSVTVFHRQVNQFQFFGIKYCTDITIRQDVKQQR